MLHIKQKSAFFVFTLWISCLTIVPLNAHIKWSPVADLSPTGNDSFNSGVVIDHEDNATVIWANVTAPFIQVSTAFFGGHWSHPTNLSEPGQQSFQPQIVVDKEGNLIAIWESSNGTNFIAQSATKPFGKNWSQPANISDNTLEPTGNDVSSPEIALDPKGNAVAVWYRPKTVGIFTNNIVQAAAKPEDGIWTASVDVTSPASSGQGDIQPEVAVDFQGNAIAVWASFPSNTIRAALKPFNSTFWSTPIDLSSGTNITNLGEPQITFDEQGNAFVIWTESTVANPNDVVFVTEKPFNAPFVPSSWSTPLPISDPAAFALLPQIAVDRKGNAIAVWVRSNGTTTENIQGASKPLNKPWSTVFDISPPGIPANEPHVTIDRHGKIYVVWIQTNGSNFIVQYRTKLPKKPWSTIVPLSAPGQDASGPQIAVDKFGNVVVDWTRSNGSNFIVQAIFGTETLFPPQNLHGKQIEECSGKKDCYSEYIEKNKNSKLTNVLKWDPSISEDVAGYDVYRNGKLVKTIHKTGKKHLHFEDPNRKKGVEYHYRVTAFNSEKEESIAARLTLP